MKEGSQQMGQWKQNLNKKGKITPLTSVIAILAMELVMMEIVGAHCEEGEGGGED